MSRYAYKGRNSLSGRSRIGPVVLGLAIWIGFPTLGAYQDVASLVSQSATASDRWSGYVEQAGAGSVQDATLPFVDSSLSTGSIAGGGVNVPGLGRVAFAGKGVRQDVPDEQRINRGEKSGRLLKVAPVAPPAKFNAGSVVRRTSSLLEPRSARDVMMAFVDPKIKGNEIQIATAFHVKTPSQPKIPGLSTMVASLINNPTPDILAAAYAPPEPDFARASPFDSVLREGNYSRGRFVPPVDGKDHAWLRRPLPKHVFNESEQRCLTAGIYFEARGEPVRGQAAVAQVILNRVRNPAYPETICGVVYQNQNWRNRCQFSFACDGIRDRIESPRHWKIAQEVAQAATAGMIWLPEVGSSTHYHADYVKPRWAGTMKRMKTIGRHIFYRTKGGGWS